MIFAWRLLPPSPLQVQLGGGSTPEFCNPEHKAPSLPRAQRFFVLFVLFFPHRGRECQCFSSCPQPPIVETKFHMSMIEGGASFCHLAPTGGMWSLSWTKHAEETDPSHSCPSLWGGDKEMQAERSSGCRYFSTKFSAPRVGLSLREKLAIVLTSISRALDQIFCWRMGLGRAGKAGQ